MDLILVVMHVMVHVVDVVLVALVVVEMVAMVILVVLVVLVVVEEEVHMVVEVQVVPPQVVPEGLREMVTMCQSVGIVAKRAT